MFLVIIDLRKQKDPLGSIVTISNVVNICFTLFSLWDHRLVTMRLVNIRGNTHKQLAGVGGRVANGGLSPMAGLEAWKHLYTRPSQGKSSALCKAVVTTSNTTGKHLHPSWHLINQGNKHLISTGPTESPGPQLCSRNPPPQETPPMSPVWLFKSWPFRGSIPAHRAVRYMGECSITNSCPRRTRRGKFQQGCILRKGSACRAANVALTVRILWWLILLLHWIRIEKLKEQLFVAVL